jgi:hypothetical protein
VRSKDAKDTVLTIVFQEPLDGGVITVEKLKMLPGDDAHLQRAKESDVFFFVDYRVEGDGLTLVLYMRDGWDYSSTAWVRRI